VIELLPAGRRAVAFVVVGLVIPLKAHTAASLLFDVALAKVTVIVDEDARVLVTTQYQTDIVEVRASLLFIFVQVLLAESVTDETITPRPLRAATTRNCPTFAAVVVVTVVVPPVAVSSC
jgi:hypothetical protein